MRTGVSSDKTVRVRLLDMNDEVPKFKLDTFTGQVKEEAIPDRYTPVAVVEAVDRDAPNTAASKVRLPCAVDDNFMSYYVGKL